MKTYEYTDDTWWDDNGCDCCEPVEMPCYNLIEDHELYYPYSCHSVEECYRQVLEIEGIIDEDFEDDIDFEQMCRDNGIEVIIHFDEEN